jgi:aspartyl aminopeptidase
MIHCHLNDSSEDATLEVVHLKPVSKELSLAPVNEAELNEYKDFKLDVYGKPLRYKIFVRDLHVKKVLYNTGNTLENVNFTEQRI